MISLVEKTEHNMALKDQVSDSDELVSKSLQSIVKAKAELAQENEE